MSRLMERPPYSEVETVTDMLHGVAVMDPYRWLEAQDTERTRAWIDEQTRYTRAYLDNLPGRERIRKRVREFLAVETYDSLQMAGGRYFFRKRLPNQEQPCIYMRAGADGEDQLLIDPAHRGTGTYTAVKPLRISSDGRLLLYEVKEGGERTGTFELLEIESGKRLLDFLPRGYLRGFAFAPDGMGFYYVHEAVETMRPFYRAAYRHVFGTDSSADREIFFAGEDEKIRLSLIADKKRLCFFVHRFLEKIYTDIYLRPFEGQVSPRQIFNKIEYSLSMRLTEDRILAITDRNAPNQRIVEIRLRENGEHEWIDVVPETDALIKSWLVTRRCIYVSYIKEMVPHVLIYEFSGKRIGEISIARDETIRLISASQDSDELLFETESFVEPSAISRYSRETNRRTFWARRSAPLDPAGYRYCQTWYASGATRIPIFLVGHRNVLERGGNPAILTSYGGFGVCMTPRFSVLVAFLMERGCLFALPSIRGGSEFGVEWHRSGKRRNRQTAYDDFLCAAKWLIQTGRAASGRLAIFGGSNAGLLVGAALTQRPDLFCAAVCISPLFDMLRYQLFDNAQIWKDEFGMVDDPKDFAALAKYSPYYRVQDGVEYPATMIVSGDADQNCNALHARKMTARLQAANTSEHPIILDYSTFRGHSPVLPLSKRVEALTNRLAFLCDQLQLSV